MNLNKKEAIAVIMWHRREGMRWTIVGIGLSVVYILLAFADLPEILERVALTITTVCFIHAAGHFGFSRGYNEASFEAWKDRQ